MAFKCLWWQLILSLGLQRKNPVTQVLAKILHPKVVQIIIHVIWWSKLPYSHLGCDIVQSSVKRSVSKNEAAEYSSHFPRTIAICFPWIYGRWYSYSNGIYYIGVGKMWVLAIIGSEGKTSWGCWMVAISCCYLHRESRYWFYSGSNFLF